MQIKAILASYLATLAAAQSSSTRASSSSTVSSSQTSSVKPSTSSTSSPASSSATAAAGQTIRVDVGKNGLTFSPSVVQAAPGAKVEYHYYPRNHSIVQSSFAQPCQPLAGGKGINSGFIPTAVGEAPQIFTVTVNDINPVWIYCSQTNGAHCQAGMSMVINQPVGPNTLQAYQAASKNATTSGSLPTVQGGVLGASRNGTNSTGIPSGRNSTSTSANGGARTTSSSAAPNGGAKTTSSSAATNGGAKPSFSASASSSGVRTTPAASVTPGRPTPTPFRGNSTTPSGPRYTGGAGLEAVSWGVLGAGMAVAGFFL